MARNIDWIEFDDEMTVLYSIFKCCIQFKNSIHETSRLCINKNDKPCI